VAQFLRYTGQIEADRPDAFFQTGWGHHVDATRELGLVARGTGVRGNA
jgi:hypothetical protein